MIKQTNTRAARLKRHRRLRAKVEGAASRPRLAVFRSLKHIYAQLIEQAQGKKKTDDAKLVGEAVAKRALEAGISRVVFDRGGFLYHGRVKALADAARGAGLEF